MKKRIPALMLALALLLFSANAALAGNPADLAKNLGDFSQYGEGNMDKYDPPITMSIGIPVDLAKPFPEGDSYEDNVWSRAYAEELGINLELAFATPDSGDKVNALIASGDIPDLLTVNMSQLIMLSNSGLIRDDIYEAYNDNAGMELRQVVEGVGGKAAIAQCTFNGKMMAFPKMNTSAGEEVPVLYLRTDWMDKLGLEDPQNWAELRAIMEAFVAQDPDGNGEADTIGIAFSKDPWSSGWQIDGFMNIFGAFPKSNFWVDDPENEGQVVYGAFQPEVKTALTELNKMYNDGLLDKEFAIKDWAGAVETYASGKCGVLIGAVWMTNACLYANVENNPGADWHAVALPGLDTPTTKVTANYPIQSYMVFNKDFTNPEALIKMVNLEYKKCFSPDSTQEVYDTYIENSSGGSSYQAFLIYPWGLYLPAVKNEMSALYIAEGVKSTDSEMPIFARPFAAWCEEYEAGNTDLWRWYRFFGPDGGHQITAKYIAEDLYYMNRYYGPNTATMAENMALVTQLVDEMVVKMIMGEASVDDFDRYKEQADQLGLGQMTIEANEWLASNQ